VIQSTKRKTHTLSEALKHSPVPVLSAVQLRRNCSKITSKDLKEGPQQGVWVIRTVEARQKRAWKRMSEREKDPLSYNELKVRTTVWRETIEMEENWEHFMIILERTCKHKHAHTQIGGVIARHETGNFGCGI